MWHLHARVRALLQTMRCLFGQHEYSAEAPEDADGHRTGVLRERCLHCGAVTDGWDMGTRPAYVRTQEADRARLVLHNGRLRRCPCAACETRRRDRRQRVVTVTRMKGAA